MRRSISCMAAPALCVTLALGAAAVPSAASERAAPKTGGTLTRLSPASRQVLATKEPGPAPSAAASRRNAAQPASGQESFLRSTRGKVTLALLGAGVGVTLWSIQHDRKPVKSPIR
ncbi:MAG: hypothetical protein ABIQ52_11345 [Vicinamibacterales bacterium]